MKTNRKITTLVLSLLIVLFLVCICLINHVRHPFTAIFSKSDFAKIKVVAVNDNISAKEYTIPVDTTNGQNLFEIFQRYEYNPTLKETLSESVDSENAKWVDISFWKDYDLVGSCIVAGDSVLLGGSVYTIRSQADNGQMLDELVSFFETLKQSEKTE